MKTTSLILLTALFSLSAAAQKQFTKTGHIWFYSHAALEDITAHNYQATSVLNTATGEIAFKVTMTAFQFEKALMQDHFNEKYVESEKFPESTFKGKISDTGKVDFTRDGSYPVQVEGDLTVHGVTKPVKAEGDIIVKSGKVYARSLFKIALADYGVKIPSAVKDNIAKEIDIHVDIAYEPLN